MSHFKLSLVPANLALAESNETPFRMLPQPMIDLIDMMLVGDSFNDPTLVPDGMRAHCREAFGLPPIQPYPKPRLNQLFWPTGYSRFGIFRGVMHSDDLDRIKQQREAYGFSSQGVYLRIMDTNEEPIEALMFMLPPVPLTGLDEPNLFLITLVDERYWSRWEISNGGSVDEENNAWTTALPGSPTISADYGRIANDSPFYSNGMRDAGTLWDAGAWNVGRIVVQKLSDGTTDSKTYNECSDIVAALNTTLSDSPDIGGEASLVGDTGDSAWAQNIFPTNIIFRMPEFIEEAGTYPWLNDWSIDDLADSNAVGANRQTAKFGDHPACSFYATQDISVSSVGLGGRWADLKVNGRNLYVWERANYRRHSSSSRTSERTSLTNQVAKDILDSLAFNVDKTYGGIRTINHECGCDITWTYGPEMSTRIRRDGSCVPSIMWHALSSQREAPEFAWVKITADDSNNAGGTIYTQSCKVQRQTLVSFADETADFDDGYVISLFGEYDVGDLVFCRKTCYYETDSPSEMVLKAFWTAISPLPGAAGGGGVVTGPGSSTDNVVMRFDGTGGSTAQNSGVIVDDSNNVSGVGTLASGTHTVSSGDVVINTAGGGLKVKEGSNATSGVATLSGGTVTVNTTEVTANSRIHYSRQTYSVGIPGVADPVVYVSARSAGTSFTLTSSNSTETSDIAWLIVEPA